MFVYESLDVKIGADEADRNFIEHLVPELNIYSDYKNDIDYVEYCFGCDKLDLAFILLRDFSYLHELRGRYLISGAAVGKKEEGVLMIGGEGIGKSTITYLLYRDGFEYIGDDALLLYDDEIIGGNNLMKFDRLKGINISGINNLEFFRPDKKRRRYKIKHIIIPNLNYKGVRKLNKEDAIITIYNEITKIIRAVNIITNNFTSPACSLDNEILANKRLEYVNELVKNNEVYVVGGNSSEIKNIIVKDFLN